MAGALIPSKDESGLDLDSQNVTFSGPFLHYDLNKWIVLEDAKPTTCVGFVVLEHTYF